MLLQQSKIGCMKQFCRLWIIWSFLEWKWRRGQLVPKNTSVVSESYQRVFLGNTNGLQMTAPSRFNSNANSNGIDEICGQIIAEEGKLPVGERNLDRGTHTHHMNTCKKN